MFQNCKCCVGSKLSMKFSIKISPDPNPKSPVRYAILKLGIVLFCNICNSSCCESGLGKSLGSRGS